MKTLRARVHLVTLRTIHYVFLLAIALTVFVPFGWMISTSLKDRGVMTEVPPRWIPETVHWENYPEVLIERNFLRFSVNSIIVSLSVAVGQLFTCSLAGFAFARMRFPGRNVLFAILLATMMVPIQVMIIPEFLIMLGLGWVDHPMFLALIVPSWLAGSFGTFLLRQFFMAVPQDLEDAARIDGCSIFGIYWKIFLPLAQPALATLFIFAFMSSWNQLLRPILYLTSRDRMTLTIGLAEFTRQYEVNENLKMTGSFITLLPLIVLYAFAQKYFVRGITLSGLKG
jgi:multiple sugar transport system permease protein